MGTEKEIWTLDEIKDLGPLSETEKVWVFLQPGVPYHEWIIEYEKEQKELKAEKNN